MKNKHNKSPDKEFAKRMRTLMGNRNIRLVDISKATNNAVSTVSTWRRGRYPRSIATIRKLAEIFSVTPEYLMNGKCNGDETVLAEILNRLHKEFPLKRQRAAEKSLR